MSRIDSALVGATVHLRWRRLAAGAFLLIILLGAIALVATPSVLAQQPLGPSPTYDPAQVTKPLAPPSARVGQPIYAENCAPCHGATGAGDGPSAAGLNAQPAIFADASTVWGLQPAELFFTTKYGRMQNMMPPWSNSLSDAQIWNAVAYAWSLHTSEAEVTSGAALYTANCAACHGDTGKGDGPDAQNVTSDFSDPSSAIFRSQSAWDAGWTSAHPEVGAEWSTADRSAVLEYVRTFSQAPPWAPAYQPGTGVIRGVVAQGSTGSTTAVSDTVQLNAFLGFDSVATFTTTLAADGSFAFDKLSLDPNLNYMAAVGAGGSSYSSTFMSLSPITQTVQTTITVFDSTNDPSVISIARLHWIVEIEQGALLIGQIYAVSNSSDRTYVGTSVDGANIPVTFAMQVPPDAQQITFDSGALGQRFQQVGPVVYDTLPIAPGQGTRQIIMRYVVPYTGTTADLKQPILYPAAEISMLVSDMQDMKVEATGLTFASVENMGNVAYQFWSAQNAPASTLDVTFAGLPEPGANDPRLAARQAAASSTTGSGTSAGSSTASNSGTAAVSRTTPAPLAPWASAVLAALVVAILAGALFYATASGAVRTHSSAVDLADLRAALLGQLAHLDDLHALGDVNDNDWMRRRSQLKAQLLDVERRQRGTAQTKMQAV